MECICSKIKHKIILKQRLSKRRGAGRVMQPFALLGRWRDCSVVNECNCGVISRARWRCLLATGHVSTQHHFHAFMCFVSHFRLMCDLIMHNDGHNNRENARIDFDPGSVGGLIVFLSQTLLEGGEQDLSEQPIYAIQEVQSRMEDSTTNTRFELTFHRLHAQLVVRVGQSDQILLQLLLVVDLGDNEGHHAQQSLPFSHGAFRKEAATGWVSVEEAQEELVAEVLHRSLAGHCLGIQTLYSPELLSTSIGDFFPRFDCDLLLVRQEVCCGVVDRHEEVFHFFFRLVP